MNRIVSKSWQLNRRSFLRGTGVALALPALDVMAKSASVTEPRRLAAVYFPFGVSIQGEKSEKAEWGWFPKGEGREFSFNKSLQPLEAHRENVTVLGGLSHPEVRKIGEHDSGDTFLTGCDLLSRDPVSYTHLTLPTIYSV